MSKPDRFGYTDREGEPGIKLGTERVVETGAGLVFRGVVARIFGRDGEPTLYTLQDGPFVVTVEASAFKR